MKVSVLSFKNSCADAADARLMAAATVMIVNTILILSIIAMSLKLTTNLFVRKAVSLRCETPDPQKTREAFTRSEIRWLLGEKLIFQQLLHPFDNRRGLNHDFF